MKSVLVRYTTKCFECGSPGVEEHHCIAGNGRRKVCDRYHLTVPLCRKCHEEIHRNRGMYIHYAQEAQNWYEHHIGSREDFIKDFGRSYI